MTQRQKALVIGDDTRSFLATVRSLGRQGIEVHVAPYNMRAPALASRYIAQTHRVPYYLDGGADWLRAMQKLLTEHQYALVIPCEERSLLPLYKHQHELPSQCVLAIPSPKALDAFFDKINTRQLATAVGVPIAKGRELAADDTADTLLAGLSLPIIFKQRQSYSWPELYVRTSVKVIQNRSQLESLLSSLDKGCDGFFFEEMFPGRGLGVSVLCHLGEVLQAFEHHRAHELGGSSYYRKSAPLDAARLAAVSRMAKAVDYTGLAMFEFKLNESNGEWILLEVNARPWGSLPLPVAVGVDFPYQLYQLLVTNQIQSPVRYRANIYARNVVADLWQMRAASQAVVGSGVIKAVFVLKWLAGYARFIIGREHHDAFDWSDKRPAWVELKQVVQDRLDATDSNRQRKHLSLPADAVKALANHTHKTGQPATVIFVCQGNICRSPFAQLLAQKLFSPQSQLIQFESAGMLPRNTRHSPDAAITAAATLGVDLGGHQSKCLTDEIVSGAQLLIIFDTINLRALFDRYPDLQCPVSFLGSFEATDQLNLVNDPEGRSVDSFIECYKLINKLMLNFKKLVTGSELE